IEMNEITTEKNNNKHPNLFFESPQKAEWSFDRLIPKARDENKQQQDSSWIIKQASSVRERVKDKAFSSLYSPVKHASSDILYLKQLSLNYPIAIQNSSYSIAVLTTNSIDLYTDDASQTFNSIPLEKQPDNHDSCECLCCLAWSINGKYLAYGDSFGNICVFTADGQLLHQLQSFKEDHSHSFANIWFTGSDVSQSVTILQAFFSHKNSVLFIWDRFIDLICLSRNGQLYRYVMSRDVVASCANDEQICSYYPKGITCCIVDNAKHRLYTSSYNPLNVQCWKLCDKEPWLLLEKQTSSDDAIKDDSCFTWKMSLSPDGNRLLTIDSLGTIYIFQIEEDVNDILQHLQTFVLLSYIDGSISFHQSQTLNEIRFESTLFHHYPQLYAQQQQQQILDEYSTDDDESTHRILVIDVHTNRSELSSSSLSTSRDETTSLVTRLFSSLFSRYYSSLNHLETLSYKLHELEKAEPLDVVNRLISERDYGEALRLCHTFNLDTDSIYQLQWKQSLTVTEATIHSYLYRISKRAWVLNECLQLLCSTFDEQWTLLQFGLQKASSKQLFLSLHENDQAWFHSINDEIGQQQTTITTTALKDEQNQPLTLTQKQLIIYRRKLLIYKQKLDLYERLRTNTKVFNDYSKEFYETFRDLSLKDIAIRFARQCQLDCLDIVLNEMPDINPLQLLEILTEIPETTDIQLYEKYLPSPTLKDFSITQQHTQHIKQSDWSDVYDEQPNEPEREPITDKKLRLSLIDWYTKRVEFIEQIGLIQNAIDVVEHGIRHQHLDELSFLHEKLQILSWLNYHCDWDYVLDDVKNMTDEEITNGILRMVM
ncbi:unnamed protein product, partial [Didymodactylos carnosus]